MDRATVRRAEQQQGGEPTGGSRSALVAHERTRREEGTEPARERRVVEIGAEQRIEAALARELHRAFERRERGGVLRRERPAREGGRTLEQTRQTTAHLGRAVAIARAGEQLARASPREMVCDAPRESVE